MDENTLRSLRQAYRFEEWAGRNTLPENLFVHGFSVQPGVLPGWRTLKTTAVRLPGSPPLLQSMLVPETGAAGALLRLDVYECGSRAEAHDFLVRLVGQFQTAGVSRRDELELGDVNFTPIGAGTVVFTRANLAFLLAQAGPVRLPVPELARQLDRGVSAKPPEARLARAAGAAGEPVRLAEEEPGGRAVLELGPPGGEAAARREAPAAYHKIFSASGEVRAEGDRLVYEPSGSGPPRIEVYAVESPERVVRRSIEPTDA